MTTFSGLMIATPCYGGVVTNAYLQSMLRTSALLLGKGMPHEVVTVPDESLVTRARNALVATFMVSPHSHLLFIDADIEWSPDAVLRLLAADKDMICGAYPKKKMPPTYALNLKHDADGRVRQCPTTGAVEILDAASGFLMIRRPLLERMMAAYPQTRYTPDEALAPQAPYCYALFDCVLETVDGVRRYLSEDYGFCHRWRAIGGEIWLDPEVKLNHHGTMSYRGDARTLFKPA
ncbi:hypothetical protein [Vineibacter terrae]|uniref:glycosyltransferase family 2 protein n=1 Tax=Vineibacter terrae TaxID=2586908 RepID=UPI002E364B3F|nr:hypothetical protein [Vineibacter terrae]HEX2886876.1 hypothetical protein [Vineibacter terrae]